MATQEQGKTKRGDLSQPIHGGAELSDSDLEDHLANNIRQIMNSTGAAMRVLDTEFNVVLENDLMEEMGGVSAEGSATINCYDQFSDILHTAKAVGFPHWGLNPQVAGGSQVRRRVGR